MFVCATALRQGGAVQVQGAAEQLGAPGAAADRARAAYGAGPTADTSQHVLCNTINNGMKLVEKQCGRIATAGSFRPPQPDAFIDGVAGGCAAGGWVVVDGKYEGWVRGVVGAGGAEYAAEVMEETVVKLAGLRVQSAGSSRGGTAGGRGASAGGSVGGRPGSA